jgi:uncharacterized C2H2 Zn-finger protein
VQPERFPPVFMRCMQENILPRAQNLRNARLQSRSRKRLASRLLTEAFSPVDDRSCFPCAPLSCLTDHRAIVCPLCAKTIHFLDGQDVHAQFQRHVDSECAPETRKQRTVKPRCVAPGCREKLSLSTRIECKQCGQLTCMAHRHIDDHACPGRRGRGVGGFLSHLTQPAPAAAPSVPAATAPAAVKLRPAAPLPSQRSAEAASAALRETAARRARPDAAVEAGRRAPSASGVAAPPAAPSVSAMEQCPQCEARFVDVGALVSHVDTVHGASTAHVPTTSAPAATRSSRHVLAATEGPGLGIGPQAGAGSAPPPPRRGDGSGRLECCPTCGMGFSDAAVLVRHTEGHRWERRAAQQSDWAAAQQQQESGSGCCVS